MMLPTTYIFLLTFLIPGYYSTRIINYGNEADLNTNQLVLRRFPSESCEGDESVSFKYLDLTNIPSTAIKSSTIRNVNLDGNLLNRVPTEIFDNVPSLECLNLAKNKIPYQELFNFSHSTLKTLIVDGQTDIDEFNMVELKILNYRNAYFPKLEMLHINGISKFVLNLFPKNIFPQLTTLYLTENNFRFIERNFISTLPTSLEHLHFERNSIKNFNVHHLGKLRSLYLDENPLERIGINSNDTYLEIVSLRNCKLNSYVLEYFSDIYLNDLETLDLSENELVEIPQKLFQNAKNLQILHLSNNLITEIPTIKKLHQLHRLSLSFNRIANINNLISGTLVILNLANNKISDITDENFSYLPNLEELDLSNNKLKYLAPGWAYGLKNLKQLNLRFNNFIRIADMSLTSLVDLEKLFIKGNLFNQIDEYELELIPETCTTYVM